MLMLPVLMQESTEVVAQAPPAPGLRMYLPLVLLFVLALAFAPGGHGKPPLLVSAAQERDTEPEAAD